MSLQKKAQTKNFQPGTIESLLSKIQKQNTTINKEQIQKAYEFSKKAHQGQKRKSGEDYVTHPVQVAEILADLHMDQESIITALLHDVVEDTPFTLEDIKKEFNPTIAFLVDGVTKVSRIAFNNVYEKQSENMRKMMVAMGKDVRVILIKLADRLHNLRSLDYMSPDKKVKIATETLEVYTPLAGRLGMHEIKTEMEDISFKHSQPENFSQLEEKMKIYTKDKNTYVKKVINLLKKSLEKNNIWNFELSGRYKNLYSIHRKMTLQNISFEEIHDIIAFRICLENIHECYEALGLVHALWKPVPGRFKDFIAMPKRNHYQSLHTTVLGPEGRQIEIQIRTYDMHLMAERGVSAHWAYKLKGKKIKIKEGTLAKFNWLYDLVDWHKHSDNSEEFLENVKGDLFESEIYIFTPEGDIKEFPKKATPIDFAYSIHTQVGEKTVGAKVNGLQVPLNYELKSGDTVEIITSKKPKPSKDWLKMCVTSKARSKIKSFFRIEERKKSIEIGSKIFEKNCHRYKISEKELLSQSVFAEFMKSKGYNKKEDVFVDLGFGKLQFKQILLYLKKSKNELGDNKLLEKIDAKTSSKDSSPHSPLVIEGADNVMVHFARCCYPVAGDRVKAYVSKKKGIVVHRNICKALDHISSDRFIQVDWKTEETQGNFYTLALSTVCLDKPGTLSKLSETFNFFDLNINNLKINRTNSLKVHVLFDTKVKGLRQTEQLISRLNQIDNVLSVKRKTDFE